MERLERDLEQMFVDVAMAEDGQITSLADDLEDAAEGFECTLVDVAFAEAGEFTETACVPRHHK